MVTDKCYCNTCHSTGLRRPNPRDRVFENDASPRVDTKTRRASQENLRVGLASVHIVSADNRIEVGRDTGHTQEQIEIATRRRGTNGLKKSRGSETVEEFAYTRQQCGSSRSHHVTINLFLANTQFTASLIRRLGIIQFADNFRITPAESSSEIVA